MKPPIHRLSWFIAICLFSSLLAGAAGIYGTGRFSHSASAQQRELSTGAAISTEKRVQVADAYGKLPLRFEANRGQADAPVKFISRNSGHTLFLTPNEAVLRLQKTGTGDHSQAPSSVVRMKLAGANRQPSVIGLDELAGKSNYFTGDDPKDWRKNVANYAQVKYSGIYPGIDLVWYGNHRQLEHDFLVAPGADPRRIRWSFTGAQPTRIDGQGALILQTGAGDLKLLKPLAWQKVNGRRQEVACEYVINRRQQIEFRLGQYDPHFELVIDPVLLYSSYLGGNGFDQAWSVAVDKDGSAYVAGLSASTDFPDGSQIQPAIGRDGVDAFVLKLNPAGTEVVYGTWLGGSNEEIAQGVAVDKDGNAYVTGYTFSKDFPKTAGALQQSSGGYADGFIARLNATGSALIYSSYLGGSGDDSLSSIAVDGDGNIYLTGSTQSSNLPVTGIQQTRGSQPVFKSADRAGNWTQIGNTLNTTQAFTLAVDPTNPNTLYAGTFLGVYKSTDGGQQWQATGQTDPTNSVIFGSIAIDPSNPNRIYATSRLGGIYRSTDGGQSYQVNVGINFNGSPSGFDVVIDPVMPATLYLGTSRGVYKSVNGGDTWVTANNGLMPPFGGQIPRINRLVIDPSNRLTLYAATTRNVYKTVDGGANWVQVRTGLGQNELTEILALAIDPTTPATLYAGTNGFSGGLYKTTDGGMTWRASATGLTLPNSNPQTVQSLAIDPSATMTVYAGTTAGGVYKSTDGGANWSTSNIGLPNTLVNAVVVDRTNPANVYAAVSAGSDAFAAKINPNGSAVVWLTYLGGAENDDGRRVAVDKDGNSYFTGSTNSRNFPTASPFQAANGGGSDAFVAKINPAGSALSYSTYFGGNGNDTGRGIAVNDAGQVFITGSTVSSNLPTKNPLLPAYGGGSNDAYVAKFNAAGSALEYSSWLGGTGNDNGSAIAVDGAGNAYVVGETGSANFPLVDAPQTQLKGTDAFVAKLNPAGASLLYSTFLGGASTEAGNAIAVDSTGNAYVVGNTFSEDFPTVTPLKPNLRGDADGFITKLGVETDLAIAKTASRNPVLVNNNFSYTLTATNNGPSAATGVVVMDQLPAGINFVSATSSQGSCANNAGTVTCNIGNLAVQGKAAVTLTVAPTQAGSITNLAAVRGNETDSSQTNNQAMLQVTISNQPSIYGRVTLANGNPLAAVTINLIGAATLSQQTNAQGFYQFASLPIAGNYTVTPASANYSFEPAMREINNLTADQSADFVATQCTYALSPTNQNFEANGGAGTFTVAAPPRCAWTAAASASWIKITSGLSGAGNGTVSFTVDPAQTPRAGRITVAGQSFLIWQGVNVCNELKFRPRSYYSFGFPNGLFADDLNGDGLTDLIVQQQEAEFDPAQQRLAFPLVIYYGEASGRLTPGPRILTTNVNQPRAIAVGDFNGDGRRDLAVSPGNEADARLLLNNGSGGFTSSGNIRISPLNTFDYAGELRAADFNKDGKVDLIGVAGEKVLVVLNTSSGGGVSFAAPIAISYAGQTFRNLADVNSDGLLDLITSVGAPSGSTVLSVYLADGFGSFRQPVTSLLAALVIQTAFADFNADGNPDLALTTAVSTPQGDRQKIALAYGDGAGRFGQLAAYDPLLINPGGQFVQITTSDVNNDARQDVIVLSERKIRAVLTNSDGQPGSMVELGQTSGDLSVLAAGNFDGGGRVDFATIDLQRSSVVVFWNRCGSSGLTISGQVLDRTTPVGFGDVTVKLTGAQTATVTTDSGGNYEFTGLAQGNYTVMAERGALEFNPASQTINNLTTDQVVNFSGTRKGTAVSAASFSGQVLAPDSIASIFGVGMSRSTEIAQELPLPIRLANQYVYFKDSAGVERAAQLFFVSPNQINFLIPAEAAIGPASIRVFSPVNSNEPETTGTLMVENVAPGLFAANANGAGVAAAVVLRVKQGGGQHYEPVSNFDGTKFVSVPIDLGPDLGSATDQVFLLLFGTGIRNNSGLANVTARIGGEAAEVLYAGPQGGFAGLDQLNLALPRSLAGRGEVDVMLTVDGKQTNTVRVNIK